MKSKDAATPGSRSNADRMQPATTQKLPAWQELARRILPSVIRRPLNRLNLARIRWQQKLPLEDPAEMLSPGCAEKERFADPAGPFFCPVCETHIRTFVPGGHYGRPNAKCPVCGSLERHRAAWIHLTANSNWIKDTNSPIRLLHVAPEAPLENRFRGFEHIDYISSDLEHGRAMITMDLTSIDICDGQFDIIFCSHVLEHVPDDIAAMSEMHRILKPQGLAYIQVPLRGERTYEDPTITSPQARRIAFGQEDHVRMYGWDICSRLKRVDFEAEIVYPSRALSSVELRTSNIGHNQSIIVCRKATLGEH